MLVFARQTPRLLVFLILVGVFGLLGISFFLAALAANRISAQRVKRRQAILTHGIETTGVITYLDRNFSLRLNGRFPYSIVEYRFTDADGHEQVVTDRRVSAEQAIRQSWQVGTPLLVRYLRNSPKQSTIVTERSDKLNQ